MFCQIQPNQEMLVILTSFIVVYAYVVLQIGLTTQNPSSSQECIKVVKLTTFLIL